jgi:cytoskeletal protein CcmA (bactofilin family)
MSNPYDNARDTKSSVLGPTLKFKGELSADEDLLINGRVEGSIKHSSSLTIGESGHVKADVTAEYIAVEGRVEGDLHGRKCVKIRETAKIDGNIVSPNVSLIEGAKFNGKIDMDGDPTASVNDEPTVRSSDDAVSGKDKVSKITGDDAVTGKDKPAKPTPTSDDAVVEAAKPAAEKRPVPKKSNHTDKKSANAA